MSKCPRKTQSSAGMIGVTIWLLISSVTGCSSNVTPPPKPSLVPASAVWAGGPDGGSFIECDVGAQHNVNRCLAYKEFTGDVTGGGFFQLSGSARAARLDELRFNGFDGDRIYLEKGMLIPTQPIPPVTIPKNSVFTSGLFISCPDAGSPKTDCSIYRPDGGQYFKGEFVFTGEHKTAVKDEFSFKFFDLSDRTIYLEGGGTYVAK
jgi:hypothetical protein